MSRPAHFSGAYTLVPDNTYTVNGSTYHTDANGRISTFDGELSANSAPRSPSSQRNLPGKQPGEDAGHLIPASRGGSGKVDNLVRMDNQVNVRHYRGMERENDALMKEGQEVTLHGAVTYPGESNWPDSFMVTREVTDPTTGESYEEHFSWTNVDMAQFDGEESWVSMAGEYPNPGAEQESAYCAELEGRGEGFGPAAEDAATLSDSFGPDGGSAADDAGDGFGPSDSDSDGLSL